MSNLVPLSRDAVELTRALVRIDTVNPPGRESDAAAPLAPLLTDAGFRVASYELSPGRASLVARIGGSSDKRPLCFTGHLDTVPLGARPWVRDPFAAELAGGRLHGRGTSDMKSGVAAMVVAAVRLAPKIADTAGAVLVLTASEETGCEGARHLAKLPGALGEAGAIVVGEPTGNDPYVGHKGTLWLEASTRGVTAHGSMPERGDNAIYKAARAALALEAFAIPGGRHPVMGPATLNVGTIRGGLNINSVPDAASLAVDVRTVPGVTHAEILERLREHLGPEVDVKVTSEAEGVYTDPSDPWVERVYDLVAEASGKRPVPRTLTYFTDASALGSAYGRSPTVILGPGDAELAHQTDESCSVDGILEAVAIYEALLADWCGI